jgi:hypothetical protein
MSENKKFKLQDLKEWPSTSKVAEKYNLARQNVFLACKSGRFTENEAVETCLGWLISPDAAKRLWGSRINEQ